MNKLLRLPHWMVFIYLLVVPAFFPDGESDVYYQIVWALLFLVWVIKINQELNARLPRRVNLNFKLMTISYFISAAYLITISLTIGGYEINEKNYHEYGWKVWIFLPMHFYCFFSLFYGIRFTAKAIACIENDKRLGFAYYFAYMVGLFFFPIGIWWIQPKINRILATELQGGEQGVISRVDGGA